MGNIGLNLKIKILLSRIYLFLKAQFIGTISAKNVDA